MFKFYIGFMLVALASVVYAVEPFKMNKELLCADTATVMDSIIKQNDETPVWVGKDSVTQYVLTENKKTKEWTMIQYNGKIACIIALGVGAKPVFTD
jgi:hypothetical protein